MAGILTLVGTPIGNLADLSDRAREILGQADVIACEDTRHTGRLLAHAGIEPPRLVSYFDGNEAGRTSQLLQTLRAGESVALVTDAGMPGISDPGERLVAAAAEAGIEVRVVPGPSASLAALVVSGLATQRFVFEGFLPRKGAERKERLAALQDEPRTMIIFESAKRTVPTLREFAGIFGADRPVAMARELTKLYEEVARGTLESLATQLAEREDLRGEVVLVLAGATEAATPTPPPEELAIEARVLIAEGLKKRAAASEVARRYKVSANDIYRSLL